MNSRRTLEEVLRSRIVGTDQKVASEIDYARELDTARPDGTDPRILRVLGKLIFGRNEDALGGQSLAIDWGAG